MFSEVSHGARALVDRALADGWSEGLEREVDDYENYLSAELERFDDMDPARVGDGATSQRLMTFLGALIEVLGDLRDAASQGALASRGAALRAAVEAAGSGACDEETSGVAHAPPS